MSLFPWEHVTPALCHEAAEKWLREHDRSVRRVYEVEFWAAFYESAEGEARHQRWEIAMVCQSCDKGRLCSLASHVHAETLLPAGSARAGWPVEPVA